jgi:FLVCR family feline leukemia virus subgroup C receptor-related protein
LLPGYIVGSESSPDLGKALFLRLLLIEAIAATALCIPVFLFFRERPPTPPSASASMPRENFKKGVKLLVRNTNFLWLLAQQGCVLGSINSLATVMQAIIFPFGYTQLQSSTLGVVMNVASVVGCLLIGIYVEKTKRFRISIIVSGIIGLCAYGLFTGVLYANNFIILAIATCILGFVLAPSGPLALEFGCELTFPVGEATSGGVILSVIQIFCPVQTFIIGGIMGMKDQKKAGLYSILMLIGFMAVGWLCSLKLKQNLVRSAHDKKHDDRLAVAVAANAALNNADNNLETPCPMVEKATSSPTPSNLNESPAERAIAL